MRTLSYLLYHIHVVTLWNLVWSFVVVQRKDQPETRGSVESEILITLWVTSGLVLHCSHSRSSAGGISTDDRLPSKSLFLAIGGIPSPIFPPPPSNLLFLDLLHGKINGEFLYRNAHRSVSIIIGSFQGPNTRLKTSSSMRPVMRGNLKQPKPITLFTVLDSSNVIPGRSANPQTP